MRKRASRGLAQKAKVGAAAEPGQRSPVEIITTAQWWSGPVVPVPLLLLLLLLLLTSGFVAVYFSSPGSVAGRVAAAPSPTALPPSLSDSSDELPETPIPVVLQRDLGYLDPRKLAQLEALIDVPTELTKLPASCAVCRLGALEVFSAAVQLGMSSPSAIDSAAAAAAIITPTAAATCARLGRLGLLGAMKRRAKALGAVCDAVFAAPGRRNILAVLAGELAAAAASAGDDAAVSGRTPRARIPGADADVANVCADVCPIATSLPALPALPRWPAVLETVLGREPLGAELFRVGGGLVAELASPLLYFAAAKSDVQALRVLAAVSGASPHANQQHGAGATIPWLLGAGLARLMTPPSARQQLGLLKVIQPAALSAAASSPIEGFRSVASARLTVRIDGGAVDNDTALHVAAYGYDHDAVLAMLVGPGGGGGGVAGGVDTVDSAGRTALHYTADMLDQIAGYVNVFAEPPADMTPVFAQRTASGERMAADLSQAAVAQELGPAQFRTARLLLLYGANPNVHSTVSGSTPLHLAARSGAAELVGLLLSHGAAVEARDRRGATPLLVAAAAGHGGVCTALLQAGARPDARNAAGRTAGWFAAAAGSAMPPADAARLFGVEPAAAAATANDTVSGGGGWGNGDADTVFGVSVADLDICELDRRPSTLSPAVFESDYLAASRPVLVERAADAIPAKHLWSRAAFFRRVGGEKFRPQKLPMWTPRVLKADLAADGNGAGTDSEPGGSDFTLSKYFGKRRDRPVSWNSPRNETVWAELAAELRWPATMLAPSTRRRAGTDEPEGYFGLFMGPQRSGVTMHHHKSAWNALLFGKKLWALTPPADSSFRRDELAADSFSSSSPTGQGWLDEAVRRQAAAARAQPDLGTGPETEGRQERGQQEEKQQQRMLFCVQREGDVLFVPQGWGHSTLNLRESIGVANFFLDEDASEYRPSKLFHSARGIRSLQTAAGITAPSDFNPDGHP
jgi:hypothetical protein